jgi:hypothetical protein
MPFFPRSRGSDRDRRRADDGVHVIEFELETLEFVAAGDEVGLLRVGGHWYAPTARALGDIVLMVHRDSESLEIAPLPDLNGVAPIASPDGEEWHGAFTMTVEVADDPRTELALGAGPDAEVALPRPGEWERLQPEDDDHVSEEPAAGDPPAPAADPPVVADLVAQLDAIAAMDDGEPTHAEGDAAVPPATPDVAPAALPTAADEIAGLRAELDLRGSQLETLHAELADERRRRAALEQELRAHAAVEDDLRNALAMREAEIASATAQAQRALQSERRRELAIGHDDGDHAAGERTRAADDDFIARIERARRASEAAS